MDRIPTTRDGLEKLKQELSRLERVDRPENIRAIEEARGHGDLSENAEYHAAKERQGFIEAKINELRVVLGKCEVIEVDTLTTERVVFGRTVQLYDLKGDRELEYCLVGPYESEPDRGRISVSSPMGQALLGSRVGDEVQVRTPAGIQEYEVLKIT